MAKYSQKQNGKEVGQAPVYAAPHTMSGDKGMRSSGVKPMSGVQTKLPPEVASRIPPAAIPPGPGYPSTGVRTEGVKIRGTGCATKGTMARGPMA